MEKSITKIKFTEKVSYFEAKKRIENSQSNLNFAGAVKQPKSTPKTCEIGIQTTLTWLGNTLTPTTITAMPATQTIAINYFESESAVNICC